MISQLRYSILLPANFRPDDILAFHRRDAQEVAERVSDTGLQKGIIWCGMPACLHISFSKGKADAVLSVDSHLPGDNQPAFEAMILRMLGSTQGVAEFEAHFRDHPQLGPLIARQHGLRVAVAATPFEALTWAVTGQQISVSAAVAIRRKLVSAANVRHSGGLLCYPDAGQIIGLSEETMRRAGFSATKSRTLRDLAQRVADDRLPLDAWTRTLPIAEMRERLEAVCGIGSWTVNYALLRGFGWLDGSLHGDAAVRRGLQALLDLPEKPSAEETEEWLTVFSPWRALVAAHIWAAQTSTAY